MSSPMDNGYRIREKKSPSVESVGFLGHVCRLPRQNPFTMKKNVAQTHWYLHGGTKSQNQSL